ncbi:hypothetical protein [Glaciimonas immobilis]|uniref:hypothetical protein n=1 Tax=Glaciimonas immobilis TaxID=728004 RepID=UPI001ADC4A23|nr:hypothetical protein [Glaciimonas immobilis]
MAKPIPDKPESDIDRTITEQNQTVTVATDSGAQRKIGEDSGMVEGGVRDMGATVATQRLHTQPKRPKPVTDSGNGQVAVVTDKLVTDNRDANKQRTYRNVHADEIRERDRLRKAAKRAKPPE